MACAAALVITASAAAAGYAWLRADGAAAVEPQRYSVDIGGSKLILEAAETSAAQELGLGGRDSLAPDAGMIFPFASPGRPGFWMKGMRFPLDFIYVRGSEIVELKEGVQTTPLPTPFFPAEDADAVIEVNAGWIAAHAVRVGERIDGLPRP